MEKTHLSSSVELKSELNTDVARTALPRLNGRPVSDLVWLQTSFIGDMILTTAAMAAARDAWPDVRQSVITTATGVAIFHDLHFIDRTFLFAKRKGTFWGPIRVIRATSGAVRAWRRRLPAGSNPVVLQVHKSVRSSIVSRMTGLPVVTYREASQIPFFGVNSKSLMLTLVDRVMPFHESARIAMLLEPLGLCREKILAARPQLTRSVEMPAGPEGVISKPSQALPSGLSETLSSGLSGPLRRIAIAPGSVWGTKRWIPERFARLGLELLAKVPGARIVLMGSPDEVELCAAIARKISNPSRVENLCGKILLKDLPQAFAGFELVITNDSSPVHFAGAVNVATVAIFGATIPQFGFAPLAQHSRVVQSGPLPCRPCSDHGPQVCPKEHFRCMKDISVDQVLAACIDLLNPLLQGYPR